MGKPLQNAIKVRQDGMGSQFFLWIWGGIFKKVKPRKIEPDQTRKSNLWQHQTDETIEEKFLSTLPAVGTTFIQKARLFGIKNCHPDMNGAVCRRHTTNGAVLELEVLSFDESQHN